MFQVMPPEPAKARWNFFHADALWQPQTTFCRWKGICRASRRRHGCLYLQTLFLLDACMRSNSVWIPWKDQYKKMVPLSNLGTRFHGVICLLEENLLHLSGLCLLRQSIRDWVARLFCGKCEFRVSLVYDIWGLWELIDVFMKGTMAMCIVRCAIFV